MEHPSADEYVKAVQQPGHAFAAVDLQQAQFDVHPLLGVPMPASGSTAVVFKAVVDGEEQALRFFTREDASNQDRYTALGHYVRRNGLVSCVATSDWVDEAILVKGRRWPMVRMQWINGRTLDQYVDHLVDNGDRSAISALAGNWRHLIHRMQHVRFAHGDLQHGNVLVDQSGSLRLVDFDCAWIAPFVGESPPTESGHRNYQRPGERWGPHMDTFPALVIYLSLLALGRNVTPWRVLNNGENLIFRWEDFEAPHETPAWKHLAGLRDRELDQLAALLRDCCRPGWKAVGDLEMLIHRPISVSPSRHPWVEAARRRQDELHGAPGPPAPRRHTPAPYGPSTALPPPPPQQRVPQPPAKPIPHPPTALPHQVTSPPPPRPGPWWGGQPGPPAQPPHPAGIRPDAKAMAVSVLIALVSALVVGTIVSSNRGPTGVAVLITMLVAGSIALAVQVIRNQSAGP